jgi:hypothetical protein
MEATTDEWRVPRFRVPRYEFRVGRSVSAFRFPAFCFSLSPAHQTTFFKKKKTYGNLFKGTDSWAATSNKKNRVFRSKMIKKSASRPM